MSDLFGDRYHISSYTLTGDPREADNGLHYSDEIEALIQKAYKLAQKPKKDSLTRLLKWVSKYPHVPAFKNYLTNYYMAVRDTEKAYNSNKWLIKEHPDYLYGKLNLASQYISEEKYEEVEKILGKALDLQDLYPDREVFHIGEYISFLNITSYYLMATNQLEAAASRIYAANDILPDHPAIQELMMQLDMAGYDPIIAGERTPHARDYDPAKQTTIAPNFTHDEINNLYKYGFEIDHEILKSILALPPKTLVEDLQKVLQDSINRYEYFIEKEEILNEESFPLHALFLLSELKTKDSLSIILDYLTTDEEILDYWFEDHYTETLWQFIYKLGQNNLSQLKEFQYELNVGQFSKGVVMEAVSQMALNTPSKRTEIINWYKEVGEYFIDHPENDDLIDTGLIAQLSNDLARLKARELIPMIERFYQDKLISIFVAGPLEEIEELMEEEDTYQPEIYTDIFSHYTYIEENWDKMIDSPIERIEKLTTKKEHLERKLENAEKELEDAKKEFQRLKKEVEKQGIDTSDFSISKQKNTPKVGRNEPCPCGSGKKYKKCCMRV